MRASATTSAYRATSRAPLEGARARSRGLAFASRRARPARGNFGRLISDMSPSTLAPHNGENAALGAGAAGGGVSFPADDAASSELSDRGRRTLARALGNVETPSGSLGLHFSSHPLDHAGKVDAAASAPAALRPRQSNVVARAKGDDKPRDASKDLAATNPESQTEHPDPVAAADPADENAASDEADAAEKDHPDAPEPAAAAAAAAAADDDDDAPAAASSVVAATSAASSDRGALRAIVDNAEVLCLVAAGGVKAAQIRARLAASPRASSRDARFVTSRASAAPPPALPAYADWVADGALFGAMAVGAILRRTGVINNVVPTRRASASFVSAATTTVAAAAAEGQLTDVVERVRARAARLAEVKKTLADSRSDLKRAAEAATAATAAAKAKAEAEAAEAKAAKAATATIGTSGPSVVAEADARAAAAQEMAEAARRRATMFGEEQSKTRYFAETQEWSEETAVTRTVRSTRAGSGPPPPLGSATDASAFGRELAPPRERTTMDAFTGSMEAMEVDQEMIDLRAEVERLRAAAEAYEAGEEDDYFDVEKRR